MNKFLAFLLLIPIYSYGQIKYEKGYFISNDNKKTECLIKNMDWDRNPTKFKYKTKQDGSTETATITATKEFGIYNFSKFVRFQVAIDQSIIQLDNLSSTKEPVFTNETHFLKVLVEGPASLYSLSVNKRTLYFLKTENNPIEQLIYKTYLLENETQIRENKKYKNQLRLALKNDAITLDKLKKLGYNKKELVALFVAFNQEETTDFVDYDAKQKRKLFYMNLLTGVDYSSFSMSELNNDPVDFDAKASVILGVEFEFVLPFHKDEWSIFLEPSYHYYSANTIAEQDPEYKIDYKRMEVALGLRHYFFLTEKSKIYVDGLYSLSFALSSSIDIKNSTDAFVPRYDITPEASLAFGTGYSFKNYKFGFRYDLSKNLLTDYGSRDSDYNKYSLIVGYTLF